MSTKKFSYNRFASAGVKTTNAGVGTKTVKPKPASKFPQFQSKPLPPPPFSLTEEYKTIIRAGSYIGKKGYTIPKTLLDPRDLEFLYKDLYMIPEKQGPSYGAPADTDDTAFPVYRENTNKIYVPRFYGIARYGYPDQERELNLDAVVPIHCVFDKPLRDYQDIVVDTYLKHVRENPLHSTSGGILTLRCGQGKTVLSIKIISAISKKTLIIVHKEFLLNQWVERINEFLPTAKIGRIQGPTFDVEGKDIVIGMLQTLYDRDFPEGAFDPFGLTIVDEVHRIGSCQFSKALLRIQTPLMLGVTATLDRKDGLTKVIHHFMGPLIYNGTGDDKTKTAGSETVLVRGMKFISPDTEFNEVITDYRGNPMFSTMISKLCSHGPRTKFLVQVMRDLVKESPEAQILVLGHNRCLLVDLHEAIETLGFATVGYYLGGMKQHQLEKTTEQKIILASYAMASEGFDHKNLSILVMITPKTDIVQSVGRIFRTKHDRPLIVDIVDKHDIFNNQWNKRRIYYKKCGYRIQTTDSTKYIGNGFLPETMWSEVSTNKGGGGKKQIHDSDDDRDNELQLNRKCHIILDTGTYGQGPKGPTTNYGEHQRCSP
jgi:superfamily II DNA or RNA helicase